MEKTSTILVTGASGLIGSALVRLLKEGGYKNLLTPTHEELDICNQHWVLSYFDEYKPSYVFHLAAHVGGIHDNSNFPAQFIYNNTIMHCNIIDACNLYMVKKLLFPGSACAYPRNAEQPIKESSFLQGMPEPTNLAYAIAKQNGIVMAQSYAKQYGMNVVLPMVANTYGIGDKSSHVIPDLIKKACASNLAMVLRGSGSAIREFIYADDVANAFLFLMNNYNSADIINVGTGEEISIFDLSRKIAKSCNPSLGVAFDCLGLNGIPRKCLDSSRLYAMGWKPKVSLEEGLRRVIANQ